MKILVAVDFSDITSKVISHTASLAHGLKAEVVLLHVAEPNPDHIAYDMDPSAPYAIDPAELRDNIAERLRNEHRALQEHAETLRRQSIDCKALMIQGEPVSAILDEADKLGASFIVAGSHGKGLLSQMLLGGVSEDLVRKATLPVHLVPATH